MRTRSSSTTKKPTTRTEVHKKLTPEQKKFQSFCRRVERSNEKFRSATAAEKRCMVARDILEMLRLKRLHAKTGAYVLMGAASKPAHDAVALIARDGAFQVQDILKMPALPACNVCAIGAAMVATTLRLNRAKSLVESRDSYALFQFYGARRDGMAARARSVFPDSLLRAMEHVFEDAYSAITNGYSRDPDACMVEIYQNILKNKGEQFTSRAQPYKVLWRQR